MSNASSKKEYIDKYKRKLSRLSEEDKKRRDVYLHQLAIGELQGPPFGYSNIDKPWLKYYTEENIYSEIPMKTAYEYLCEVNKGKNHAMINFMGYKISVNKFNKMVRKTVRALTALGVAKGDVVIINSVTLPQNVILFYALNDMGVIANTTDLRTDATGMKHYINEGNSKIVFTFDATYEKIKSIETETNIEKIILLNPMDILPAFICKFSAIKENKQLTKEERKNKKNVQKDFKDKIKKDKKTITWKEFIKKGKSINLEQKKKHDTIFKKNQIIAIVHTSGTTGMPKSIALTNENFNAMAVQYANSDFNYAVGDSILNIIPMFTAYGLVNSLHMPLCLGMTDIVYPKVVEKDFPDIIRKFKPNHVIAIPMHWEYMINNPNAEMDLSYMKTPGCGGDKLNIELEKEINQFLKAHGAKSEIIKGYGMTEVSACAVTNTNQNNLLGSVGIPQVKNNIRIIDPDTQEDVLTGQKGEICINTPSAMKEYYKNLEETEKLIERGKDGLLWVHSGDLGHVTEDGQVFIDGRLKRLIIRKGFKISAVAIENVITKHSDVDTCAVVKVVDECDGEVPFTFIVLKDTADKSHNKIISELVAECKKSLPEFSQPEYYEIIDSLPYTKTQKVDIISLEKEASEIKAKKDKEKP